MLLVVHTIFTVAWLATSCRGQSTPAPPSTTPVPTQPLVPDNNDTRGCLAEQSIMIQDSDNARILVVTRRGRYLPGLGIIPNTPTNDSVRIRSTQQPTVFFASQLPANITDDPNVEFIEEDMVVCADKLDSEVGVGPDSRVGGTTSDDAAINGTANDDVELRWNIDRIDQERQPLDGQYCPPFDGTGVDIYILDSGINRNHRVFGGRAAFGGYDHFRPSNDPTQGDDNHGHGTHCAGLAAGRLTGVAWGARVYSIKVLNNNLAGFFSYVIAGINHVIVRSRSTGRRSVISMSLIGPITQSINIAIREAVSAGIVVVTAAGNFRDDSCRYSPSSSDDVINVGGTQERGDQLYWFNSRSNSPGSNFGKCVDIFAPGQWIRSAGHKCNDCVVSMSGTSMACPTTAGAVALLLQRYPSATPSQIKELLIAESSKGVIDLSTFQGGNLPTRIASETPNRLINVGTTCPTGTTPPPTTRPTPGPTTPPTPPPKRGCTFEGQVYSHDDRIQSDSFNCSTRCNCNDGNIQCRPIRCYSATCWARGDPHFVTFNSRVYDFHGEGEYTLVKFCSNNDLIVTITNEKLPSGAAQVEKATVSIARINLVITLQRGDQQVLINGNNFPPLDGRRETIDEVAIEWIGGHPHITLVDTGIEIAWYDQNAVKVSVRNTLRGLLCGLGGYYSRDSADDFRRPDGSAADNAADFGLSWAVNGNTASTVGNSPNCKSKFQSLSKQKCDVLTKSPFQSCHSRVNPQPYIAGCEFDYCHCPGPRNKDQCVCNAIAAYVQVCADSGVVISNWRKPADCSISCPAGKVYKQCGSLCQLTCSNYESPTVCSTDCAPGCFCPDGQVLASNGSCIDQDLCNAPPRCKGLSLPRQRPFFIERFYPNEVKDLVSDFLNRNTIPCFCTTYNDDVDLLFAAIFCKVKNASAYEVLTDVTQKFVSKTAARLKRSHKMSTLCCYYNDRNQHRCTAVFEPTRRPTAFSINTPYRRYQERVLDLQQRKKSQTVFRRRIYFNNNNQLTVDAIFRRGHSTSLRDEINLNALKLLVEANKKNGLYLADGNARIVNGNVVYSVVFTTIPYGRCEYLVIYQQNALQLFDRERALSREGYHITVIIPDTGELTTLYTAVFWR